MTPQIVARDEFIVVGIRTLLEKAAATTGSLWKDEFLPRRCEVKGCGPQQYYAVFSALPGAGRGERYEYVAGVVSDLESIPEGMVGWILPDGDYAELEAAGLTGIGKACGEIIEGWLPESGYHIVQSPMFAYTTHPHPDSPEAVWKVNVPVATSEELETLKKWEV